MCITNVYYIGKLFCIYKLIHVDFKPRILIASFNDFFVLLACFFKKEKKGLLYIDVLHLRVII